MSRLPSVGDGGLIDWVSAEGDRPRKGPVVKLGEATGREGTGRRNGNFFDSRQITRCSQNSSIFTI